MRGQTVQEGSTTMTHIRVLLVDDQPTIRQGLRLHLATENDISIAGEADDGPTAIELAMSLEPDVVVMDISMPGMDGFEAARQIRRLSLSGIVMLSLHDDAVSRARAISSGASAFVSKHDANCLLAETIRRVATGAIDPGQFTNGGP
jgi:DNA-binding NarL/FixJ family response regulator